MNEPANPPTGSMGFVSLLTLAFIILKLCHVIKWSWWLVLAPAWGSVALIVLLVCGILAWVFIKSGRKNAH